MRLPIDRVTSAEAGRAPPPPDADMLGCEWDQDLRLVGLEPGLPAAFRIGVSLLALTILGAAVLAAFLASGPGAGVGWLALALAVAAGIPWAGWLVRDDDGPSWAFAIVALAPLAALGAGRWVADAGGLGGDLSYRLVSCLGLLVVLLYVAFARARMAGGVAIAAFATFAVPVLAGWVSGRSSVDLTDAVIWLIGFAFCVVAAYAVRLSYITNRKIGAAREALAWQAAADQRQRVARDVHDVVAHTLAVTMLHITAARMAVRRSSPAEAVEALEEAERQGRASLADIRRIVRLLRSEDTSAVDAAQPGLADIESLAGSYRAAGLPVELSLAIDAQQRSPTAELAVYRVLQEALANAARHGRGPTTVELRVVDGEASLKVSNPVGLPAAQPSQGSGLLGMRERIAAAGGTIEAGVRHGRWVLRATVPNGVGG